MQKWLPLVGTAATALVTAFTPQLQDVFAANPTATSVGVGLAGIFLALAQSPRQPK